MKRQYLAITLLLLLSLTLALGCARKSSPLPTSGEKPGGEITIIDEEVTSPSKPVSVVSIKSYPGMEITAWLDETTVILSKENSNLPALTLEEYKNRHPRSLFTLNLNTQEERLLLERAHWNLWGGQLSGDKKSLLFQEYTLGDPAYFLMGLGQLPLRFDQGVLLQKAMGATWTADNTVIGPSYEGGVFLQTPAGTLQSPPELSGLSLIHAVKLKDGLLFTESSSTSLKKLQDESREITTLPLDHLSLILPSPSGTHFAAVTGDGAKSVLVLADAQVTKHTVLAEGLNVSAVSWSKDQRWIAYALKKDVSGTASDGLYIYDLLSGTTTLVAVDGEIQFSVFSDSGDKLSYTKYSDTGADSTILTLTKP